MKPVQFGEKVKKKSPILTIFLLLILLVVGAAVALYFFSPETLNSLTGLEIAPVESSTKINQNENIAEPPVSFPEENEESTDKTSSSTSTSESTSETSETPKAEAAQNK